MTILRLLGSSDDKEKEKIGVARPEGLPLRGFRYPVSGRCIGHWTAQERASVHWASYVPETMSSVQEKFLQHRFNRRCIGAYHRCNDVSVQEKIPSAPVEPVKHRCIDRFNRWSLRQLSGLQRLLRVMSDRMNRHYPAKRHRFFRWYAVFQLTVGATATRLGGLYIRLTPAI